MRRTALLLLALCAAQLTSAAPADLRPSELAAPQPGFEVNQADGGDSERNSRAVEPAVNAKFGIKNFILDLIFGKINQAIDAKTRLVAQLDRLNIDKNRNLLNTDCENAAAGGASAGAVIGGGGGAGVGAGASIGGLGASAGFSGYPASSSSSGAGASAGAGISLFG